MCAYSLVLGGELQEDLVGVTAEPGLPSLRLRFAQTGGEIIVDQMRWLTDARESRGPAPVH